MNQLMRKIVYYENVLDFDENIQSTLQQFKDRQICRTCLFDTSEEDHDISKMCIMGMDGILLNVQSMLAKIIDSKFLTSDKSLPQRICKNCLQKTILLYTFQVQVNRAEDVLNRIMIKLRESEQSNEPKNVPDAVKREEAHCSSITKNDSAAAIATVSMQMYHGEIEDDACTTSGIDQGEEESNQMEENDPEHGDNLNQEYLESESLSYEITDDEVLAEHKLTTSTDVIEALDEDLEDVEVVQIDDDSESCHGEILLDIKISQNIKTDEEAVAQLQQLQNNDDPDEIHQNAEVDLVNQDEGKKQKGRKTSKLLLDSLKCSICNKTFNVQRELIDHVHREHPNDKAFKCRECGNLFSHIQSLSRHMQTHRPARHKNECNLCGKAFLRADDWKRHYRIHTGERPYACDLCEKAFKQPSELKAHKMSHAKEKLYECDICGHRLSSRNGIYIHLKAHKGIKNYSCTICSKRFLTNGELKSHMHVHLKKMR